MHVIVVPLFAINLLYNGCQGNVGLHVTSVVQGPGLKVMLAN